MTVSIRRRVLLLVMAALATGASLLIVGSWWILSHEMEEVFEDNLKQVALAVANHHGLDGAARPPRLAQQLPRVYEETGKFEFVTTVWSRDGARLQTSDESVRLPFLQRSGLSQASLDGQVWHVYTVVLEDGVVQAAQLGSERESLSRETASTLIPPTLGFLVVIAALLTLALRRGLAPLALAASEVTGRSVEALHPIALSAHPPELHLLVGAVNDLMARLGSALATQRHFLADAAHELRTPITALRLQLQLLERAQNPEQRDVALGELRAGMDRAQHLVEQLLQLSRLGPETPALRDEPVDLAALARSVAGDFSARADQHRIDLGAIAPATLVIRGDASQLRILLNNLVDNALRHSPDGGKVDVEARIEGGRPCLVVTDGGNGIPPGERERVFDRFYRAAGSSASAPGSGLGLAIVKAVAESHSADVALEDAPGHGLRVKVWFPPR